MKKVSNSKFYISGLVLIILMLISENYIIAIISGIVFIILGILDYIVLSRKSGNDNSSSEI